MVGTTSGARHGESPVMAADGLRWWIVGVVLGAAVLAVASLSGELTAQVASDTDATVSQPAPLR
jgi:hypothetical protein